MDITEKQVFDYIFPLKRAGLANEELVPYIEQFIELFDGAICTKRVKELVVKAGEAYDKESGNINLSEDIREFVMSTSGHFLSTDVHRCLHLSTRRDKKTASEALSRLVKQGIIERTGNKNGQYKRIESEVELVDWMKDQGEELKLSLPLDLDKAVKVLPKSLIVVAGMSNCGKTAFMLNLVGLNLDKFKGRIKYFTSEMGASELKARLSKFDLPLEVWNGCNFYERSSNFSDVISKDDINIIDYYEISSEFSDIGEGFKKIYDKLDKGVAVIALQKSKEKEYGRGSSFSVEKPRLYITLDEHIDNPEIIIAKIIKAKNWKTEINPTKRWKKFKIRDGCKIEELTMWLEPEKGRKCQ